jgi:hypothetical protein
MDDAYEICSQDGKDYDSEGEFAPSGNQASWDGVLADLDDELGPAHTPSVPTHLL